MRVEGTGFKLGMELRSEKEGVSFQLHDLDKIPLGVDAGGDEAALFELGQVFVIDLVPMAVSFGNIGFAIGATRRGARLETTGIRAKAHGATEAFLPNIH